MHLNIVDLALRTYGDNVSDLLYATKIVLPFSISPSDTVLPTPLGVASLFDEGAGVMQLNFRFSVRVDELDSVDDEGGSSPAVGHMAQMRHLAVDVWRKKIDLFREQKSLTALRLCFCDKKDAYRLSDVMAAYGKEEESVLLKNPIGDVRVLVPRVELSELAHPSPDDDTSDQDVGADLDRYSSDASETPRSSRSSSPIFDFEDDAVR
ncbi:MAG: hypothetical protein ACK5O7_03220 [Holosporales bacterium]